MYKIGRFFPYYIFIGTGLFLPIVLLVGAIQFRSHLAYSIVIGICFLSLIICVYDLLYFLDLYLTDPEYNDTFIISPIEEIKKH